MAHVVNLTATKPRAANCSFVMFCNSSVLARIPRKKQMTRQTITIEAQYPILSYLKKAPLLKQ